MKIIALHKVRGNAGLNKCSGILNFCRKKLDFCSVVPVDGVREVILPISQIHELLVLLVLVTISQLAHLLVTGSITTSVVEAEANQ